LEQVDEVDDLEITLLGQGLQSGSQGLRRDIGRLFDSSLGVGSNAETRTCEPNAQCDSR
jgi:hypothetical protein